MEDAPKVLHTSIEAVNGLVQRGEITRAFPDGHPRLSSQELRVRGILNLLSVDQFATAHQLSVDQVASLVRLGKVNALTPFAPEDTEQRFDRYGSHDVSADAVALTATEIRVYQAAATREEAAARPAARTRVEVLADALHVDHDLLRAAILEVLNDAPRMRR
ncbi:MAG: hypothetical protein ACXVI2_13180 [Ilumatobacteraceae bacterium]